MWCVKYLPPLTLGHRLRIAREYAGLEVQQMAHELGVSRNTVGRYEAGHPPRRDTIIAWAEITDVDLDWLLGDRPGPTEPAQLERRRQPRHTVTPTGGVTDREVARISVIRLAVAA